MLQLHHPLVLASASPRRKEILEMVGLSFEVVPSTYHEPLHSQHLTAPEVFTQELACEKGKEVFHRIGKNKLVLAADTVGIIENEVLEKPKDRADAKRMLQLLSGRDHRVLTALALYSPGRQEPMLSTVETKVFFGHLDEQAIEKYLDGGEYADKAAAYAIQGKASVFVEKIEGDYFNVVGLPIATVWKMLKRSRERDQQS